MNNTNITPFADYQNYMVNNIGKQECRDWCLQEQITNEFSGLWLIYISAFCLFLYYVMLHWRDFFTKHITHNIYYKILQMLNRMSLYLQIGFIVYVIYFKV